MRRKVILMDRLLGYFSPFLGIEKAILFMWLKPVHTGKSLLKMSCNWRRHSEVKEAKVVFISNFTGAAEIAPECSPLAQAIRP
jgi:hypothetical protein